VHTKVAKSIETERLTYAFFFKTKQNKTKQKTKKKKLEPKIDLMFYLFNLNLCFTENQFLVSNRNCGFQREPYRSSFVSKSIC
jgi:hypothetical protein